MTVSKSSVRRTLSFTRWLWPLAVVALLGLQVWFPDLGDDILHDTYSNTAEGKRAFFRLVTEFTEYADRNQQPLVRALPDGVSDTLCILGPQRWPTDSEWDAILDWVADGGQLVFACAGETERSIPRLNIRYLPRAGTPDDSLPPETDLVSEETTAWWTDGRLLAPDGDEVLSYDGAPQVVVQQLGYGRVVVSASPLIFSNQLLTYGDNPALAYRLLELAGDVWGVTFDESLNKTGTPKTVALLFDTELRPITLQLMLLLVLYGWWNSLRFGPLLPVAAAPRHNIVEHADALGVAYWRQRSGELVLKHYLAALKGSLAGRGGVPRSAAVALAAERLQRPVEELEAQLTAAEKATQKLGLDRRTTAKIIRRLAPLWQALRGQRKP